MSLLMTMLSSFFRDKTSMETFLGEPKLGFDQPKIGERKLFEPARTKKSLTEQQPNPWRLRWRGKLSCLHRYKCRRFFRMVKQAVAVRKREDCGNCPLPESLLSQARAGNGLQNTADRPFLFARILVRTSGFRVRNLFSCKIMGLGRGWPVGRFRRTVWIPVFGRNGKNSPENNRAACWCRCGSYTLRVVLNRRKGVEGSGFVPLRCEIR